jgi:hypothetical protein
VSASAHSAKHRPTTSAAPAKHAIELARLQRQVLLCCTLLFAVYAGFRLAMEVYGGASIPLALAIIVGITALTWLSLLRLAAPARATAAWLVALLQ